MSIWPKFKDANWRRHRDADKRIAHGDDFAGDAWINDHGEVRYVVVGQSPAHPMHDAHQYKTI